MVTETGTGGQVSFSDTRSGVEGLQPTTCYVGNLFYDVKEDDLKREFSRYGTVKRVTIIYDGRGLSKGYGS